MFEKVQKEEEKNLCFGKADCQTADSPQTLGRIVRSPWGGQSETNGRSVLRVEDGPLADWSRGKSTKSQRQRRRFTCVLSGPWRWTVRCSFFVRRTVQRTVITEPCSGG
jgi:hypothetical protein